jgi:hypothetical protein
MLVRVVLSVRRGGGVPARLECLVWTAGCCLFLLHVWAAFQFRHGWSHADAYRHTAEQTAALTGWHWGGGLYLNYLFTLLWLLDVAADWRTHVVGRAAYPRLQVVLRGFLAFIVVNATLVFGPPGWWFVAAVLALALLYVRWSRRPQPQC